MNNRHLSEAQFQQISAWLLNEMDEPTRRSFEAALASDPTLQQFAGEIRLLKEGIDAEGKEEKLKAWHKEAFSAPVVPARKYRLWIPAAAIVLLSAGFWFYSTSKNTLYSKFYTTDPGLITPMGATETYAFDRGMVDYKTGHYKEALERWAPLLTTAPSDTVHYFTGCAELALGRPEIAYNHFLPVTKNTGSAFYHEALWYAALAQIKLGNTQRATELLEQSKYPDAPALLQLLKAN